MTNAVGYRVAIFDLYNCLCDARAVGGLFEPAFAAIREANRGTLSEDALRRALNECWFTAFDLVAQRYGFSAAMQEAGTRAFAAMEVQGPLQGYDDLPLVRMLPLRRYLVTCGFTQLQRSKIAALAIGAWFEDVCIDAIDDAGHTGKQTIFERIQRHEGCRPEEVMVIGDNPLSELAAGRRLGMVTVQTLRPGVSRDPEAKHHVSGVAGLSPLLGLTPPPDSMAAAVPCP